MKELDRLLVWYLEQRWPAATDQERERFDALLESQDADLWHWFVGRAEPPPALAPLVDEIRARYRP